jgi:hypothetical protein
LDSAQLVNFSSFKKRVNEFVTEKKIIKTLFLMGAHDRLKYDKPGPLVATAYGRT